MVQKLELKEAAMGRQGAIRLTALRVPEAELRAYRGELILAKLDFLLWGWNWVCAAMIRKWDDDNTPKPLGYRGNPETWQI